MLQFDRCAIDDDEEAEQVVEALKRSEQDVTPRKRFVEHTKFQFPVYGCIKSFQVN